MPRRKPTDRHTAAEIGAAILSSRAGAEAIVAVEFSHIPAARRRVVLQLAESVLFKVTAAATDTRPIELDREETVMLLALLLCAARRGIPLFEA